jgi:hypothetical protein
MHLLAVLFLTISNPAGREIEEAEGPICSLASCLNHRLDAKKQNTVAGYVIMNNMYWPQEWKQQPL